MLDLSCVVCFYLALTSRNEGRTKLRTDGSDWKEGIYGMINGRNPRTEKRGKEEGKRKEEERRKREAGKGRGKKSGKMM